MAWCHQILCHNKCGLSSMTPYGINKAQWVLTHWGQVKHIYISNLTAIGSDNGLSPSRRQAIIWTNDGILLIGPWGTNFCEILIGIQTFSFKKMHLKMSAKLRPLCLGFNVLNTFTGCCRSNVSCSSQVAQLMYISCSPEWKSTETWGSHSGAKLDTYSARWNSNCLQQSRMNDRSRSQVFASSLFRIYLKIYLGLSSDNLVF